MIKGQSYKFVGSGCVPAENAENVENTRENSPANSGENSLVNSAFSTNSAGTHPQNAVFPEDSILEAFYALAQSMTEGADCYIIGSILPVCAALMGRAVWLPWVAGNLYPNLYAMLAGKPGDRKTSTIDLAELIAKKCLSQAAFLPKAFSPETLFDEYDIEAAGRPDKFWILDDANAVLSDWKRPGIGERIAALFLWLYDCKGLSENFRRNRAKGQSKDAQKRFIDQTSTSIVFGATFNSCLFRNQTTRAGMQRRFLYYVAERHGRVINYPPFKEKELSELAEDFSLLGKLSGPFSLSKRARARFDVFQTENRKQIDQSDILDEALLSRLSTSPTHVLKVAMIFEACRSVYAGKGTLEIQETTLEQSIEHVDECLKATAMLDSIAQRIYIANDAEVLLARIRSDFLGDKNGLIILTRTQLTSKYAHHAGRGRGLNVQDLYTRLIPYLIKRGEAQLLSKDGKLEHYAFTIDSK